MKSKQLADLHSKTPEELNALLKEALTQAKTLKVNFGKEKNLRLYKGKRKEIAIIETLLNEKKLEDHE